MVNKYKSPLQGQISQAEAVIGNMVTAPGASWAGAPHDWMVGGNAAKSTAANEYADVIVTQAIGPKPSKQLARYSARTPFGSVQWTEGATGLGDLKRRDGSPWTNVELAKRAMGSIVLAQVVEAPAPDPSVQQLPMYVDPGQK